RCLARGRSLSHHRPGDHRRLEGHLGAARGDSGPRGRAPMGAFPGCLRRGVPGRRAVGVRAAARGTEVAMQRTIAVTLPLAAVGLVIAPFVVLGAPNESTMGLVQKIFYYHFPSAILDFVTIYVCGIASVVYLVKRSARADAIAVAAGELAVLFGACTLF